MPYAPIVTIFGGAGFVGRYIAQRMAREGWRVRVAVRKPNEAIFVRTYGVVGQVEPVQANVRDPASTRRAVDGATAAVNCVGIMFEDQRQKFQTVQVEGARLVARSAAEAGAERLVHISAIGADAESDSAYARTKAAGETAAREAFPGAVILRPSVVFGHEDEFFNRFAGMAKISLAIPLVGAETRFQPVYVDDVAKAAVAAVMGRAEPGATYELGGSETRTFRELMRMMLSEIRRRRLLVGLPFSAAHALAWGLDTVEFASLGLIANRMLTRDQVVQLRRDNVVADGAKTFADLNIRPTMMGSVIGDYLYAYRPYGQYAAITESDSRRKR